MSNLLGFHHCTSYWLRLQRLLEAGLLNQEIHNINISCGHVVRDFESKAKTFDFNKLGVIDFFFLKTDHVQCLGGSLAIDFSKNLECKV